MQKKVRVRFAPSPTGFIHIGGLRTALYNYIFARKMGGEYLLRIEDTDQTRKVEGAIEGIIESCAWAGITHDKGPYIQSERLDLYKKYADQLLESGHAYKCFCTQERLEDLREKQRAAGENPKYDGHCRSLGTEEAKKRSAAGEPYVLRLRLPENTDIVFDDIIKGEVRVNTDDLDDQVLMKSDGFPTYHMAVVIDDHDMEITHVLRGDEWTISTPKHIYLYQALGWEPPKYVHLPVILGADKKKLSKRQGDVSVDDFRRKGYLPGALVNYIALVGWSPEDGSEIMSMEEMTEKFSLDRISKSGGVFDLAKLKWINNHYLRKADLSDLLKLAKPIFIEAGYCTETQFEEDPERYSDMISLLVERLGSLDELADYKDFFTLDHAKPENAEAADIIATDDAKTVLAEIKKQLLDMQAAGKEEIQPEEFKAMMKEVQSSTGIKGKNLFMPARIGITGTKSGPDLAVTAKLLGISRMIKRLP